MEQRSDNGNGFPPERRPLNLWFLPINRVPRLPRPRPDPNLTYGAYGRFECPRLCTYRFFIDSPSPMFTTRSDGQDAPDLEATLRHRGSRTRLKHVRVILMVLMRKDETLLPPHRFPGRSSFGNGRHYLQ